MKFQFSIARLLGATAMVALTFGIARTLLDKEISNFAIVVAVFAADLGLLVLVAQKKSDLYRILRLFSAIVLCSFGVLTLLMIPNACPALLFLLPIDVLLFKLVAWSHNLLVRAEAKEIAQQLEQNNSPFKQD